MMNHVEPDQAFTFLTKLNAALREHGYRINKPPLLSGKATDTAGKTKGV